MLNYLKSLDKDYELVLDFFGQRNNPQLKKVIGQRQCPGLRIVGWEKQTTNGLRQSMKSLLRLQTMSETSFKTQLIPKQLTDLESQAATKTTNDLRCLKDKDT